MSETYIIAEAGVNHDGNLDAAISLVEQAALSGADCVKFQTFTADELVSHDTPKAAYQIDSTTPEEGQREMLRKLELTKEDFVVLVKACRSNNIDFLSTPYGYSDLEYLVKLGAKRLKLASIHCFEPSMIRLAAKQDLPVILSTGMATIDDIALAVQSFGQSRNKFLTLLHCVSAYPVSDDEANINAMHHLSERFGLPVGYSDHALGILPSVIAVAKGARVIEKHFTLNRLARGPDHAASLEPNDFSDLVVQIRRAEILGGNGKKVPQPSELENAKVVRRSLVAARNITKGERISEAAIVLKRPLAGIPAQLLDQIIGRCAAKNIVAGESICWAHID